MPKCFVSPLSSSPEPLPKASYAVSENSDAAAPFFPALCSQERQAAAMQLAIWVWGMVNRKPVLMSLSRQNERTALVTFP